MIIFPAIDLYEKKAVRLLKGDYDKMTVYSEAPLLVAKYFAECGVLSSGCEDFLAAIKSELTSARDTSIANADKLLENIIKMNLLPNIIPQLIATTFLDGGMKIKS